MQTVLWTKQEFCRTTQGLSYCKFAYTAHIYLLINLFVLLIFYLLLRITYTSIYITYVYITYTQWPKGSWVFISMPSYTTDFFKCSWLIHHVWVPLENWENNFILQLLVGGALRTCEVQLFNSCNMLQFWFFFLPRKE